jgi:hypothetical protein
MDFDSTRVYSFWKGTFTVVARSLSETVHHSGLPPVLGSGSYLKRVLGGVFLIAMLISVRCWGAPVILQQPTSITAEVGETVSFVVLASGAGRLEFEWFRNGVSISETPTFSLVLADITQLHAGEYWVRVRDESGESVESEHANLNVPGAMSNDPFSGRIHLVGPSVTLQATTVLAGREANEPAHSGGVDGASLWWSWFAPAAGTGTVSLNHTTRDFRILVYQGDEIGNLVSVAESESQDLPLFFATQEGVFYHVVADSRREMPVEFSLGVDWSSEVFVKQDFEITSLLIEPTGRPQFDFESRADSYFVLYRSLAIADTGSPITMILGVDGVGRILDPESSVGVRSSFYRILRAPLDVPLDTDGDGIHDVFELNHPSILNPLNVIDALLDPDGDGVNNFAEFMAGTDLEAAPAGNQPPVVKFVSPGDGAGYRFPATVPVVVEGIDPEGALTGLALFLNGEKVAESAKGSLEFVFEGLELGDHEISVIGTDAEGLASDPEAVTVFMRYGAPIVDSLSPATGADRITLEGAALPDLPISVVGGLEPVSVVANSKGRFNAEVLLLRDRLNRLFVSGRLPDGEATPQTAVEIIQDTTSPELFIDFPENRSEVTTATIVVAGRVGDMLSGFMGLDVQVNGQPANVIVGIGQNGTYERGRVPLVIGTNVIEVSATDEHGNRIERKLVIDRVLPTGATMYTVAGDGQSARVNQSLLDPLVVRVENEDGSPFSGKLVTFKAIRSNGTLSASEDGATTGIPLIQVRTDADGLARAYWGMGSDAGCANNRVEVTSRDISGSTFFCASANPAVPSQINIGAGNQQRLEVGSLAPLPLEVWVNDTCNGVAGIPVTYTILQGDGSVDYCRTVTVLTSRTGHAQVEFFSGASPGNHLIEADFPDNPGPPSTFVLTGVSRDATEPTRLRGLVLNNATLPIGGAICHLTIAGESVASVVSTDDGQFLFEDIPAGPAKLHVNGLEADSLNGLPILAGSFPALSYEILLIPNADNQLPLPVLLPELDPVNAVTYDGNDDLELTVEGMAGLKMSIKAGSMRRADGSIPSPEDPAIIALNQVHFDDVPMPMPDGAWYEPGTRVTNKPGT